MKNYQNNMADQDLVVHSLKVLTNLDSEATKEIRQSVDLLKKQAQVRNKQYDDTFAKLSDDGIITSVEKQILKRTMSEIEYSKNAIEQQAETLGYTSELLVDFLTVTYPALRGYLYNTLKLFDDMSTDTAIDSRETFNTYFDNYYFEENFIILAITAGVLESVSIRVLQNLQEPGEEGESALYRGGLYQYTDGRWKAISTGDYKGAVDELPAPEENSFFFVKEAFTSVEYFEVYFDGAFQRLQVSGSDFSLIKEYKFGTIYYYQDGRWLPEDDKRNWRYAAAFADVLNYTQELPQIFQDGLDNLQSQIDTIDSSLADEIAIRQGQYTIIDGHLVEIDDEIDDLIASSGSKIDHLPQYFGASSSNPNNPKEGDFFVWSGATSGNRERSKVYKYTNGAWVGLSTDSQNRNYYMMALTDLLAINDAGPGYFTDLFCSSFWANSASITYLETKTIRLQSGGNIQSADIVYSAESAGMKIDASGNADLNGNTHIKGKVAIGVPLSGNTDFSTYDVVIGGNCKISGKLAGATGDFKGKLETADVCQAAGFVLSGLQPGNNLLIRMEPAQGSYVVKWQIPASGKIRFAGTATIGPHGASSVLIQVNTTTVYIETLPANTVKSVTVDFDVTAGDVISVIGNQGGGGAVSYWSELTGALYTDKPNPLVAFLGVPISEYNPLRPVR